MDGGFAELGRGAGSDSKRRIRRGREKLKRSVGPTAEPPPQSLSHRPARRPLLGVEQSPHTPRLIRNVYPHSNPNPQLREAPVSATFHLLRFPLRPISRFIYLPEPSIPPLLPALPFPRLANTRPPSYPRQPCFCQLPTKLRSLPTLIAPSSRPERPVSQHRVSCALARLPRVVALSPAGLQTPTPRQADPERS